MDFNYPEEHLINGNINPLSPVKDFLSPFNHDDDLIDSLFSDFKKDNSLNTTVQVSKTKMEQLPNDNSLNFMQEVGSSKDKNVTNGRACELNQKLSDNKEEFKKPNEHVNRKNALKLKVVHREVQLPEIQKEPINDRLASDDFQTKKEILDLKDNKIAELE
ncbi:hypothetical protein TNCT_363101, partial [Trichonephila clavata]